MSNLYVILSIFSENNHNNLIVHVKRDNKEELKPQKASFFMTKLQ